jgi:hypothetical protein
MPDPNYPNGLPDHDRHFEPPDLDERDEDEIEEEEEAEEDAKEDADERKWNAHRDGDAPNSLKRRTASPLIEGRSNRT